MALEHAELTEGIIGAAIEVHRRLGPGFLESIYEQALLIEFARRGIKAEHQVPVTIRYDEIIIGEHRLDILVDDTIVVELKAIKTLEDVHFAIVRSYLRATGKQHGLLLNFAKPTLEIKRVSARPLDGGKSPQSP